MKPMENLTGKTLCDAFSIQNHLKQGCHCFSTLL